MVEGVSTLSALAEPDGPPVPWPYERYEVLDVKDNPVDARGKLARVLDKVRGSRIGGWCRFGRSRGK